MDSPPTDIPTPRPHALAFVFVTVLIDAVGFGIVLPVLPNLILELTHGTLATAARFAGWLGFAYAIMQFLFGPVIGGLSDYFGRRPVLIASLLAFAIDYTLSGFAPNIEWLFVGRLIAGVTGASFSTAYAYIADVSKPEERAQNFGLIGVAFGIGFILGPALGGLLGGLGSRTPFFVAGGLAFANVLYGFLFLRESLAPALRRPFQVSAANPIGVLTKIRRGHPAVLGFVIAVFLLQLDHQTLPTIWSFFTIERFHWSSRAIGLSLAAVGVTVIIVQGWLTRILVPKMGEYRAVVIGLTASALAMLVYAFAPVGWVVYIGILIGGIGGLAYPSLNALMSQRVEANAQGELQGAVASLTSLATILGPPVAAQLFAMFSGDGAPIYFPGAPFVFAAVLTAATLMLFAWTAKRWPTGQPPT